MTVPAIMEVRQQLAAMGPELSKVLPDHVTPERFERVTTTALQRAPDLLKCDRKSLFESVMTCAQDGLIPDGREAALTKFGNKVAYMPMVAGILKKVRQSGEMATITAQVVREGDEFKYWVDDEGEHLEHQPDMLSDANGKPLAVYALARTKDNAVYIEVMRVSEVEQVRNASRSKGSGPWSQWWDQMAKKTAIRRLSKRLPMSTDLEAVVNRDDQFYGFDKPERPTTGKADNALAAIQIEESIDTDTGEIIIEAEPQTTPDESAAF